MRSGGVDRRIQFRNRPGGSASEMSLARYSAKSTLSERRRICGMRAPFTNSTAASASLQPSASPVDRGIFMGFVQGVPLLDALLDDESWRDAVRLVFDALSSIRCFPDFPNPFSTPIRMPGISWCKRRNMPRSRSCFWTGARRARSPHRCATRSSHCVFTASPTTSHRQRS
jgi:hypothetical protein